MSNIVKESMNDDLTFVNAFLQGDENAFRMLVDKYKKSVYYTAYHIVGNHEDAMDLSQEAFIRAFKSLPNFKGRSNFYTWLYRIVVNLCLNHLKKKNRYSEVELDERIQTNPAKDAADALSREELTGRISMAISLLPEQQRAVFVLKNYDGFKHKEISQMLNISIGAVKAHYSLAVRKLRKALKQEEG